MTIHEALLRALLAMFPYMSGGNRPCIQRNFNSIVATLQQAEEQYHVPPVVMLTVGFLETHLGCDRGEGGNWGSPISSTQRHMAGAPLRAAEDLRNSFNVCHTWEGAISRFRSGLCRIPPRYASYPANALSMIGRLSARANTTSPSSLR